MVRLSIVRPSKSGKRHESGFALLLVLCFLVLLSAVMTRLMASSHAQVAVARSVIANIRLDAAVDGALNAALYDATHADAEHRWLPEGGPRHVIVGPIDVSIVSRSERGKINPNLASEELLTPFFQALGVGYGSARNLAAAIVDWRSPEPISRQYGAKLPQYRAAGLPYGPPGAPFQSLDELGYVLGVTPAILSAMTPHLSLAAPEIPDVQLADPVVLSATHRFASPASVRFGEPEALAITAAAVVGDARLIRRIVVRLDPKANYGYVLVEREDL